MTQKTIYIDLTEFLKEIPTIRLTLDSSSAFALYIGLSDFVNNYEGVEDLVFERCSDILNAIAEENPEIVELLELVNQVELPVITEEREDG